MKEEDSRVTYTDMWETLNKEVAVHFLFVAKTNKLKSVRYAINGHVSLRHELVTWKPVHMYSIKRRKISQLCCYYWAPRTRP